MLSRFHNFLLSLIDKNKLIKKMSLKYAAGRRPHHKKTKMPS